MAEAHTKCSRRKHGLTSDAINVEDGWYGGHLNVDLVKGIELDKSGRTSMTIPTTPVASRFVVLLDWPKAPNICGA